MLTLGLAQTWGCGDDDPAMHLDDGGALADSGTSDGGLAGDGRMADSDPPAEPCAPDESAAVPERESYGEWIKVELPGTECSDGSQYKFFVNFSETSNNLAVLFEPGGACWDYTSCYGGGRGAANTDGIPDDHMEDLQYAYPYATDAFGDGAASTWNRVFLPYCTGDVFTGDRVAMYANPQTGEEQEFHHVGHRNMLRVTEWLDETFADIPRLLVSGCSAGGLGALLNYGMLREGLAGAQCGYLLNDSGPLFSSDGPSGPVHDQTFGAYNSETTLALFGELYGEEARARIEDDLGTLMSVLAEAYPADRLGTSLYQRDLNYSLYSYETFFDFPPYSAIVEYWEEDVQALIDEHAQHSNVAYYIPLFRADNCSHCLSILPLDQITEVALGDTSAWSGTEIQESDIDFGDFLDMLLDNDRRLVSYFEESQEDGELTPAQIDECREM